MFCSAASVCLHKTFDFIDIRFKMVAFDSYLPACMQWYTYICMHISQAQALLFICMCDWNACVVIHVCCCWTLAPICTDVCTHTYIHIWWYAVCHMQPVSVFRCLPWSVKPVWTLLLLRSHEHVSSCCWCTLKKEKYILDCVSYVHTNIYRHTDICITNRVWWQLHTYIQYNKADNDNVDGIIYSIWIMHIHIYVSVYLKNPLIH